MRITCPSCEAQYDVDDEDIAPEGQEVQCSECDAIWTLTRDDESAEIEEAEMPESTPVEIEQVSADIAVSFDEPDDAETVTASKSEWEEIGALARETNGENFDTHDANETTAEDEATDERSADSEADSLNAEVDEEPPVEDDETIVAELPIQEEPAQASSPIEELSDSDSDRPWETSPEFGLGADPGIQADDSDADIPDIRDEEPMITEVESGVSSSSENSHDESATRTTAHSEEVKLTLVPDLEDEGEEEVFDEDALLETFRSQIEAEDTLEATVPAPTNNLQSPLDQIRPKTRVADIDAIKKSVRADEIPLSAEESEQLKPQTRFRRGFVLTLLLLAIIGVAYAMSPQITQAVPALTSTMDILIATVDVIREYAAKLGIYVLNISEQAIGWAMTKINGA